MPASLPAELPAPMALQHTRADDKLFARVPVTLGTARRRRVFRSVQQTAAVQWRLTHSQVHTLMTWYEDTLQAGALSFYLPVQQRGGGGSENIEARFAQSPRIRMVSARATVEADVVLITAT